MNFLISILGILSSLSFLAAAAQPTAQHSASAPLTAAADTSISSASTIPIQRPVIKSSLQTSAVPPTADSIAAPAPLSPSHLQPLGKCGPVCTRFSPSGVCANSVDGCTPDGSQVGRELARHPPPSHASGLSKLVPQDRILAILAGGGVIAGMVDWRLGVVMLFASSLPERVVWGAAAAAAPVIREQGVAMEQSEVTGEADQKEEGEADCRLVCTFTDPRHICRKYVCDCSGDWGRRDVAGIEDEEVVSTATTQILPNGIAARQYVQCRPWETPMPLAV
ncbi:hypothetical protein CERZMDRAFT_99688 [Cercospora zeae-maydis SCOH1-5]|uniref:Extracellular membrane protein CFEM domain-containing protein n=1 Tax=Cercospora zeae-maydis SCOH1-5 TaxID=717836 RepID=A0A6A6FA21_9PEZI|nr:hypothetical protein CERZMDRAFT_99688 [Cercospora zeae-maydis SCOH1-5]